MQLLWCQSQCKFAVVLLEFFISLCNVIYWFSHGHQSVTNWLVYSFQLSGYLKSSKVRQVLADLALSQCANKKVEYLNISEKRRLAIGIQLVRDPVMLLLDEPTYGLDPLSAYLLISILSNSAKKTGCGILLSLEKPRSDVFPFLDRLLKPLSNWDDEL